MVKSLSEWTKSLNLQGSFSREKVFAVNSCVAQVRNKSSDSSMSSSSSPSMQNDTTTSSSTSILPSSRISRHFLKDPEETVLTSVVFCIHHKEGCKWSDELKKLKAHLNTCKYDALACPNQCNSNIPRIMMSDHLAFTCTMRRVLCHFCCKEFSGEEMEDHAGACNQEPIYCETKCGSKILRGRMSSHKAKDCVKRLIKCEYCQKDFIADTIPLHQNTCLQKQQQQQQLQPLKVSLSPCRRSSLDELNNNNITSCDISNQNQISCFFRDAGCKFRGTQTHLDHHLDSNNSSHLLLMVQHAEKQKQQIEMLKKTITKLSTNYSGTLLWKITNWEKRMSEAKRNESLELVSPAFYTSQYGYKLQVSIFLNGNGPGESTHMSVFIKILPGEYDALLKWPFNQKVTFTLFEQSTEHDNVQGGIAESFIPDPMWKNFQTPSESAQDLGFGFPCFVSHDTLARRPFVRNDTVFLRVKCEPNKIVAV